MSVLSETNNYEETCGSSREHVRRACTKTPSEVSWAGDLLIVKSEITKQSEVINIHGGDADIAVEYEKPNEHCSDASISLPGRCKVEATPIRDGDDNSFEFAIPKGEEGADGWDRDIYMSTGGTDMCGLFGLDGGDILFRETVIGRIVSLCGTIDRKGINPTAHYLDNRNSYSEDPDRGLLFATKVGAVWEVRYAPEGKDLSEGLIMSDNVTDAFITALSALGMTRDDIIEFGMI